MKSALLTLAVFAFSALQVTAQAPKTISFQGFLTDTTGTPRPDTTWMADFALHPDSLTKEIEWSQTLPVQIQNGMFNVILGPIEGVDFSQQLWLGMTLKTEDEFLPRTRLTSVPSAFALVLPFHGYADVAGAGIQVENQGAGAGVAGRNTGTGPAGSFVIDEPSNSSPALHVETNGTGLGIEAIGDVSAHAYRYATPDTSYISISGSSLVPAVIDSNTSWQTDVGAGWFTGFATSTRHAYANASLPHGATVTALTCNFYDFSGFQLFCDLTRFDGVGTVTQMAHTITPPAGAPGAYTATDVSIIDPVIDNSDYSYQIDVSGTFWESASLKIRQIVIQYTVTEVQ